MAIIKLGTAIVGIRGTIGGATYSANKAGPYVKAWGRGSNPRTEPQSAQRGRIAQWAQNWKNLTSGQQSDWDTYAADPGQEKTNSLGEPYYVSGFNWYVALNTNLEQAGAAAIDDAPTDPTPIASLVGSLQLRSTDDGGVNFVVIPGSDTQLTLNRVVFASVANNVGRLVQPTKPRLIAIEVPDAISRRVQLKAGMEAQFGEIYIGQKWFFEMYVQNDEGRRGPVATFSGTVTT